MSADCQIIFKLLVQTSITDEVEVVGNINELGLWTPMKGVKLKTDSERYPLWSNELPLIVSRGTKMEFKFVISGQDVSWEQLPSNRKYRARYCRAVLKAEWNNYEGKEIIEKRFKSSVYLDQNELRDFKKQKISQEFDPYEQAFSDSSEDSESKGFDSFQKMPNVSEDSDDDDLGIPTKRAEIKNFQKLDEEQKMGLKKNSSKKLRKKHKNADVELPPDDYEILFQQQNENTRLKQLLQTNPTENDILYEVNDETLISIMEDNCLIICSFYLPVVLYKKGETFSSTLFEYSFNLHLYKSLKKVCCKKRWYGIPQVYDENLKIKQDFNLIEKQQLQDYLWENYQLIPVFIDSEEMTYFNQEFCRKLYQPIMNNDVSIRQLSLLDYTNKMYESFKTINQKFEAQISKDIQQFDLKVILSLMTLVLDYRLLFTASYLATTYYRLPVALFYNRHFPHLENLKLIPFYEEILYYLIYFIIFIRNVFLQLNLICFSNFNTAQQFLTIIKQLYGIDYQSLRGNLTFKYLGREICVKLRNPGSYGPLFNTINLRENWMDKLKIDKKDILIVGMDLCVHQSGIDIKLKQFKNLIENNKNLIREARVKLVQFIIKAADDGRDAQQDIFHAIEKQINELSNPSGDEEGWCVKILFFQAPQDICHTDQQTSVNSSGMQLRYQLLKRANIYLQSHFSGSHDFYLLEYINLSELPKALVSSSSCYYRGLNSILTYSIFNFKEFSEKLLSLIDYWYQQPYDRVQISQHESKLDKKLVQQNQTHTWLEGVLIDMKKNESQLKFASITTINKFGQQQKIAHNPKYQHIDPIKVQKTFKVTEKRVIIIDFQSCTSRDAGYLIDYKPRSQLKTLVSQHYNNDLDTPIGHFVVRVFDKIIEALKKLANDPKNKVFIVSSGVYNDLELHFGNCKNIHLFAENGYLYKTPETGGSWKKLFKFDNQCLPVVRRIMEQYVQKTEGSNIEYKESSLIWKINSFWEEFGQKQANDLVSNLRSVLDRFHNIEVIQSKNQVEVRPTNLNKGILVDVILQREVFLRGKLDWLLNIGRGSFDEDMFAQVRLIKLNASEYFSNQAHIYSVSLELVPSYATYFLKDQTELIQFLEILSNI